MNSNGSGLAGAEGCCFGLVAIIMRYLSDIALPSVKTAEARAAISALALGSSGLSSTTPRPAAAALGKAFRRLIKVGRYASSLWVLRTAAAWALSAPEE